MSADEDTQAALRQQVADLGAELERLRGEIARAERRLQTLQNDTRAAAEQYVVAEQQKSNLAHLYSAARVLHGSLDRDDVLSAIREVVANLVGSEEIAIYELAPDGSSVVLAAAFGADGVPQRVALGSGVIGRIGGGSKQYYSEDGEPGDDGLVACVPLRAGDRIVGVLAAYRLLPQKNGLERLDRDLFELLSVEAGMALYCSALHARAAGQAGDRA